MPCVHEYAYAVTYFIWGAVLASGAIPAREAIDWVAAQLNVAAIVFGASSRRNIRDTKSLADAAWAA